MSEHRSGEMRTYKTVSLLALLVLVIALPIYASQESRRMEVVQQQLQRTALADAATLYLDLCATCHGLSGEGSGAMPALNQLGAGNAASDLLHRTIASPPHGSAMSTWHVNQHTELKEHQVKGLVTLIRTSEWSLVSDLSDAQRVGVPTLEVATDIAALEVEASTEENPHECRSCHEEPAVHADRFGLNCSRCHSLESWKPALLTRHTFLLDHGGSGRVACQTCHTATYAEHTCYGCHDHQRAEIEDSHKEEGIVEFENCIDCHPTGKPGEADRFLQEARAGDHGGAEP